MAGTDMTHPQNCGTCKKDDCDNHPKQVEFYENYGNIIADIIRGNQDLFKEYGCASWSNGQPQEEK